MNGHAPALSPLSFQSTDWSSAPRYQIINGTNHPYSPTLPLNTGPLVTPPASGHTSSATDASLATAGRRPGSNDTSSPPSSVARSSDGRNFHTRPGSSMGRRQQAMEEALAEHHAELKAYLAAALTDDKSNSRLNKARDKLLRLSAVQFQELSTDVYDELRRREDHRLKEAKNALSDDVPPFLPPKENYHPKRNQARQKLSTLAAERFRQLAMDVYYELERRFPRFGGVEAERAGSPIGSMTSSSRGHDFRQNKASGLGDTSDSSRPGSRDPSSEMHPYGLRPEPLNPLGPSSGNNYGRPSPKTFQSNTIIPNKSTMVEDDDEQNGVDESIERVGSDGFVRGGAARLSKSTTNKSYLSDDVEHEYQAQLLQLQNRVDELSVQLQGKDEELSSVRAYQESRSRSVDAERAGWSTLRADLERRVADARRLNDSMRLELETLQTNNAHVEQTLRAQLDQAFAHGNEDEWKTRHDVLERELRVQQQVTEEVRREASQFLSEMRNLTETGGHASENEERLLDRVSRLEEEVKVWKGRYVRTKTQLRSIRTSSMGLAIQPLDTGKFVREGGFTQPDGLIKDVHVTKFQIAIDELLYTARNREPSSLLDQMKSVVVCVRNITEDVDIAGASSEDMSKQRMRLRAKVSATANNLTTACKIHSTSNGITPLSLLDAAASHLTAAVVELIRTVKICPTPAGIVGDDDDGKLPPEAAGYSSLTNGFVKHTREVSSSSLSYSSSNSPQRSVPWSSVQRPFASGQSSIRSPSEELRFPTGNRELGIRESRFESLKEQLEERTQVLVSSIQALVDGIRRDDDIYAVKDNIRDITASIEDVVRDVDQATQDTDSPALRKHIPPITEKLAGYRASLLAASSDAEAITDTVAQKNFTKSRLPPLAFKVARRTKELRTQIDRIDNGELTEVHDVRLEDD